MTKIQIVHEPTSRFGGVRMKKMHVYCSPLSGKITSEYDYLLLGLAEVAPSRVSRKVNDLASRQW
jgi:hypothetical protein